MVATAAIPIGSSQAPARTPARTAAPTHAPVPVRTPLPRAVDDLLVAARRSLAEAALATRASDRYVAAHLAGLRAGAAVLAARSRPSSRRARVQSVWTLLPRVAPELAEWAEFFATTARRRAAAESGLTVIAARDADDLVRDAESFVARVCEALGLPDQQSVRFGAAAVASDGWRHAG